jgi:hypothetical protein
MVLMAWNVVMTMKSGQPKAVPVPAVALARA